MGPILKSYEYADDAPAGTLCLARITKNPLCYQIVLTLSDRLQPRHLRRSGPEVHRFRVCWIIEQRHFDRFPLNLLYKLHPSQETLFSTTSCKANFRKRLNFFKDSSEQQVLTAFEDDIIRDINLCNTPDSTMIRPASTEASNPRPTRRQKVSAADHHESLFVYDEEDYGPANDNNSRSHTTPRVPRRTSEAVTSLRDNSSRTTAAGAGRSRMAASTRNSVPVFAPGSAPEPNTSAPRAISPLVVIKQEPEPEPEWMKNVPNSEKVKIFVGKQMRAMPARKDDLLRSPLLTSWTTKDSKTGAFIMRPELLNTRPDDFDAILQYLHSQEYAPLLLENENNPTGPKIWYKMSNGDYSSQLVRAGRLYILARKFEIHGMPAKIYQKIAQVDSGAFSARSLVALASVLFDDENEALQSVDGPDVPSQDDGTDQNESLDKRDELEQWVITRIAVSFKQIMLKEQASFWTMELRTRKRAPVASILDEVAAMYRNTGKIPEGLIEIE